MPRPGRFICRRNHRSSSSAALAHARELLLEYGRFVIAATGAAQFCFGTLEKEAADLPASYLEQGGGCLVAYADQSPPASLPGAPCPPPLARRLGDETPLGAAPARGTWPRTQLTLAVLDRARAAGPSAIYLDTAPASMAAAHRIYLELGFEPCAPITTIPWKVSPISEKIFSTSVLGGDSIRSCYSVTTLVT